MSEILADMRKTYVAAKQGDKAAMKRIRDYMNERVLPIMLKHEQGDEFKKMVELAKSNDKYMLLAFEHTVLSEG